MARTGRFLRFVWLAVLVCAAGVWAQYGGGTGTETDPYQISLPEHLDAMHYHPEDYDKCFILTADIDMSGYTYTTAVIAPDTDIDNDYQGIKFNSRFDGAGYKISNLTINADTDNDYLGLFGYIDEAGQVRNLDIENVSITGGGSLSYWVGGLCAINSGNISNCNVTGLVMGYRDVGGLVGYNNGGMITFCYTDGIVTGTEKSVGGLVGENMKGMVTSCYSTDNVTGNRYVGGLVGYNWENSSITDCHASGNVTGILYGIGGLVGWNELSEIISCSAKGTVIGAVRSVGGLCGQNYWHGVITKSHALGDVIGDNDVGGLCGKNGGANGRWDRIENCYAAGSVTGNSNVGGLCGRNGDLRDSSLITQCYAIGPVIGNENVGGLCGYIENGSVIDCFWDTQTSGLTNSAGGIGLSTTQMQDIDIFLSAGWDFVGETANGTEDIWWIIEGQDYPRLWWEGPIVLLPASLSLSIPEGSLEPVESTLNLYNAYTETVDWSLTAPEDCLWLELDIDSGTLDPGEEESITVILYPQGLPAGMYTCSLPLNNSVDQNPRTIPVTLTIVGPTIQLSPEKLDFIATAGADIPEPQILTIRNSGGGVLNWIVEPNEPCDWLSLGSLQGSLDTNETEELLVEVDSADLPAGQYSCDLVFSDPRAENSPQTVHINLDVIGPRIEVEPSEISFLADLEGEQPETQILTIRNTGGGALNWTIPDPNILDWLLLDDRSGSLAHDQADDVLVDVNPEGLPAGFYQLELSVTDPEAENSPQIVSIQLTLIGPILQVSPSAFTFQGQEEGPNPEEQILTIRNLGAGTLLWQIQGDRPDWLLLNKTSGALGTNASEEILLEVNMAELTPGRYTCTLTIEAPDAEDSPQTIEVILLVLSGEEILV
ncbi:MAG: hypothetical protein JXA82_05690, partial [Sedimentisphaerales bacterium]|nr:hypothetical protein [Sedimentisphaerales bacterium]